MTRWTTDDIPDQIGKTIIVTGANSGLGEVTARHLAAHGAHVILACRSVSKGEAAAKRMTGAVTVRELDVASLDSIRRFAAETQKVDVLINNAGVMATPKRRTVDGFELQFGTNFLGTYALTGLLLPKITERVVTLSSVAHRAGRIHFNDLNFEDQTYERWAAYGQSKLADLIFAFELQRRLTATGSSVRSLAAHPGFSRTELHTHTDAFQGAMISLGTRLAGQSAAMGALPTLFAATAVDALGGQYYGPGGPAELRGYPAVAASSSAARNPDTAAALWYRASQLTGVEFLSPPPAGRADIAVGVTPPVGQGSARALSGFLLASAVIHLAAPRIFEQTIPRRLPGRPRLWVQLSGAALGASGLALLGSKTRVLGAIAAAAIFVAILPANIQMVGNARSPLARAVLIARLPLQIPLVRWAARVATAFR